MTKGNKQQTKADLQAQVAALRERVAALEAEAALRQQALAGLRLTEAQHRILLDESSDPIFMFQPDGQYLYVNQAFADGVLRTRDEIIGHKIWDVFPKDEAASRAAVARLRACLVEQPDKRLGLSIGLAVGHEGSSLLEVMRLADLAMYQDKLNRKQGGNGKAAAEAYAT